MPLTTTSGHHFGGRIALGDKYVFLAIGDRGERERARDISDSAGSMIRLNLDGSIPTDNPILASPNARPELYSVGHRNPQGLAFDSNGHLYAHERGPQGGDEINRVEAGLNYGRPTITYGRNHGIGTAIGEGMEKEGLAQPLIYWNPSIAPSGITFYPGKQFPLWKNNMFVGALKAQMLVTLALRTANLSKRSAYIAESMDASGMFARVPTVHLTYRLIQRVDNCFESRLKVPMLSHHRNRRTHCLHAI